MSKHFFDYDDGDFAISISDSMAMDSDGDLMMRMGNHMAMDMDTGDIHMISSWSLPHSGGPAGHGCCDEYVHPQQSGAGYFL